MICNKKKFINKSKIERIIKTFIEVFSSYIAINIMTVDLNSSTTLYGLIAGAIGSAMSVVLNLKCKE